MRTAIIDGDSILFVAGHPNKVLDDDGEPIKENGKFVYMEKTEEELKEAVDSTICNRIIASSDADRYILYIKGKGNYRYSIYPEYKANRPKTELPTWWNTIRNYMIEKYKAVPVDNMEVDDACRITQKKIPNSFICAIDQDLLGLEGEAFNWSKGVWIETTPLESIYKFWGDMVCGQSGDNIKGIPGKGEKYFKGLLDKADGSIPFHSLILWEYVKHFGENKGIEEFYKNYKCLYILEESEDFAIPEVQKL
mgnify:CR=1 FL=1